MILCDYYASWNGYLLVLVNVLLLLFLNIFVVYFYITAAKSNEAERNPGFTGRRKYWCISIIRSWKKATASPGRSFHDVKNHIQALGKLYEEGPYPGGGKI